MLTSAVRFGPKSHGRLVTDDELEHAEYRPGYDYEVIFGRLYVSPAPNPEHDVVARIEAAYFAAGSRARQAFPSAKVVSDEAHSASQG